MNQIDNTKNQLTSWVSTFEDQYPRIEPLGSVAIAAIAEIKNLFYYSDEPETDPLLHFKKQLVKFEWAEEGKQLAIFYRDLVFQLFKAKQLGRGDLTDQKNELNSMATAATTFNIDLLSNIQSCTESNIEKIDIWKHYNSPIPEITQQLDALSAQIRKMISLQDVLEEVDRDMTLYKVDIDQKSNTYANLLEEMVSDIASLNSMLVDSNSFDSNQFLGTLKPIQKKLDDYLELANRPDLYYAKEMKASVPVRLDEANLEVKEIDFKKQLNFWLDAEIFPKLISMHQRTDQVAQKVVLTLSSLEGRLQQDAALMSEEVDTSRLSEMIHNLHQNILGQSIKLKDESNSVKELILKDLSIKHIFSDDRFFLIEPTQLALKEYGQSTRDLVVKLPLEKVRKWYHNVLQNYILHDDKPTNRQAAFKFVDLLLHDVDEKQEVSTFLLKGYLSDSFIISRGKLVDQIQSSIRLWKKDFQGSALVYGDYLSGRSSLLGTISHAHLGDHIYLEPDTVVNWKNHKFETGQNIQTALDQIHKMMHQEDRLLVIIDDLELWRNETQSAYDTIQELIKSMRNHKHHMYFLVSTNHWYKDYLDTYFSFSEIFAEVVNTSRMLSNQIISAVLKRHLATSSEGEMDDETYIAREETWIKEIKNISRNRDFNIGASLQEWFRHTAQKNSNLEVIHAPRSFELLVEKHQVLLQYILKFNRISEQEINRELGPLSVRSLHNDIRLLIGKKIIERGMDGTLKINEQIVYHVEKALNQILYLIN